MTKQIKIYKMKSFEVPTREQVGATNQGIFDTLQKGSVLKSPYSTAASEFWLQTHSFLLS